MKTAAALACVAAVVAMLAWRLPSTYRALAPLSPDSATYQTWDASRPPVYPLVLQTVERLSPGLRLLGPLQLSIFLACAIWLALTFRDTFGQPLVALALGTAVMAHPQVVSYAFTVLPESLLTSLIMANAAAVMRLLTRRTVWWAVAAGLTLALAILAKPVAVSFAGGLVVVGAALWRDRRRFLLLFAIGAAVVAPVVAASAWNYGRIGVFSPQAIGGYAMLGVTGTFMADETPVDPPELRAALLERVRPLRDELARLESLEMYYFFSSNAYHEALERSRAVILDHIRAADPHATERDAFLRLNLIGQRVSRQSIRQRPRAYARHVAAHLYGLWMMPLVQNASSRGSFEHALAGARARMPLLGRGAVMYRMVPAALFWPFRLLLVCALTASLIAVVMWFVQRASIRWTVAAYASVMLHGYFLLTALAQTGLPRYALAVWPLTVLVVCGVVAGFSKTNSTSSKPPTQ